MDSPDSIIDSIPNWLRVLTQDKFFTHCSVHDTVRKNEKNILCLDCCTSVCRHCLSHHHTHFHLQIRRYMYNEVIRLGDAQRLLNCSSVQPYITNRAKVVFLKQRTSSSCHRNRDSGNLCIICDRSLQEPYIFCSLSCKVHHLIQITKSTTIKDNWQHKYEFSVLLNSGRDTENPQQIEDSQVTPDSVLDFDSPTSTSICTTMSGSTSTSSSLSLGVGDNLKSLASYCTASAATESLKRKRSSVQMVPRIWCTPTTELATVVLHRRKGVPHRSPLY